ncbi:MAG: YajC family protein [Phycisphaerales bacterium]|nr:YajC family protein [Phycisphaerales bacterium]
MNGSTLAVSVSTYAGTLAQTTQPGGAPAPGFVSLLTSPVFPIFILIILLWVFTFRAKRKDEKKKKDLLGAIKRGDRVQTIGGILGKVVEVEDTRVLLKVDESSNTKIWFSRNAIFRVLGEEKAVDVAAAK